MVKREANIWIELFPNFRGKYQVLEQCDVIMLHYHGECNTCKAVPRNPRFPNYFLNHFQNLSSQHHNLLQIFPLEDEFLEMISEIFLFFIFYRDMKSFFGRCDMWERCFRVPCQWNIVNCFGYQLYENLNQTQRQRVSFDGHVIESKVNTTQLSLPGRHS